MTLVETLIVIVVLSIVAMVVLPQFGKAEEDSRDAALRSDLSAIRKAIERYYVDHVNRGPHLDADGRLDVDGFADRITQATDKTGRIDPDGGCGPYLTTWPTNPFSDPSVAADLLFGKTPNPPRNGATGWYYDIFSGLFSANSGWGALDTDPSPDAVGHQGVRPVGPGGIEIPAGLRLVVKNRLSAP
jgi:type II secretory pathway pseudopilin PulG